MNIAGWGSFAGGLDKGFTSGQNDAARRDLEGAQGRNMDADAGLRNAQTGTLTNEVAGNKAAADALHKMGFKEFAATVGGKGWTPPSAPTEPAQPEVAPPNASMLPGPSSGMKQFIEPSLARGY